MRASYALTVASELTALMTFGLWLALLVGLLCILIVNP